jgi:L-threonine-O-3-phosphate decarboxylase
MPDFLMSPPRHGGNLVWAASIAGCPADRILDFSASINPLGPPHSAIAAIQAHLTSLRDYPDPEYHQLRSALGEFHQLSPDQILPGNGSAELLTWASRELAALSKTYLLTPAFRDYLRALKTFDARVQGCLLSMDDAIAHPSDFNLSTHGLPELKHLATLNDSPNSRGLLLNNPHNPTGRLFSKDAILPYLDRFALVVVDEAFMDFLPPEQQQSLIDQVADYPNLVVLRSLTKFYSLPGLRLGYAIAHPDRLKRWQQWRDPWSVNSLAAAAGAAVLRDIAFQKQTWDWLIAARSHLFKGLQALPGLNPLPSAANFFLVQCDQSVLGLQKRLLTQHQILIRDCVSFAELGDRFFRVAVRTQSENQRLLDGLNGE